MNHSVAPLLFRRLKDGALDLLPADWRERFADESARNTLRNLFLCAEMLRILAACDAAGVRATPYKGPVAAVQAFGDVALRHFADLDVIVPQREMAAAHRLLLDLGFRANVPALNGAETPRQVPGQYAYTNVSGTHVELHSEATLRYMPRQLDLEPLLARRSTTSVAARDVQTFSPEDTLVLLAVHGSKHFWDRLGWIADIAGIAQGRREIDWPAALDRARLLGADRMLRLAAPASRTNCSKRRCRKKCERPSSRIPERGKLCRRRVCRRFLASPVEDLGILGRMTFRVRMRGGGAAGVRYMVRLAAMPTEVDRAENPLDGNLNFRRAAHDSCGLSVWRDNTRGWRTRTPDSKPKQNRFGEHQP